jgi:TldD protein
VTDRETEGIGVRVLADGCWGFACNRTLTPGAARSAAAAAAALARAGAGGHAGGVALAPASAERGSFRSVGEEDPLAVSVDEKLALCLAADEAMRAEASLVATEALVRAQREHRILVSSDGAATDVQTAECGAGISAVAAGDSGLQTRSYPGGEGVSWQGGWERIRALDLVGEAARVAAEAAALALAPPCPEGETCVVLDAAQLAVQLHESIGHALELDRILGAEASFAGTSFVAATDAGRLRLGSELMEVVVDPETEGGLATAPWDDEGVAARREVLVEGGVLRGFLGSRETAAESGRPQMGAMQADGWNRMPLVRIGNLHLSPGAGSLEDLVGEVDRGLLLATNRSWSIDDRRLGFHFGAEIAWELRKGRRGRVFRDAVYRGVTPDFWSRLEAVAGSGEWRLFGYTNCGKGQPIQRGRVSHGVAPARFSGVQVGSASR